MPARTTRQKARARIQAAFAAQLDRLIPEDETVPLKGATFADFEEQAETLAQATLLVVLEEWAALAPNAEVTAPGRCPSSAVVFGVDAHRAREIRHPCPCRIFHPRAQAACDSVNLAGGPHESRLGYKQKPAAAGISLSRRMASP